MGGAIGFTQRAYSQFKKEYNEQKPLKIMPILEYNNSFLFLPFPFVIMSTAIFFNLNINHN